jgi:hypothetical protein
MPVPRAAIVSRSQTYAHAPHLAAGESPGETPALRVNWN